MQPALPAAQALWAGQPQLSSSSPPQTSPPVAAAALAGSGLLPPTAGQPSDAPPGGVGECRSALLVVRLHVRMVRQHLAAEVNAADGAAAAAAPQAAAIVPPTHQASCLRELRRQLAACGLPQHGSYSLGWHGPSGTLQLTLRVGVAAAGTAGGAGLAAGGGLSGSLRQQALAALSCLQGRLHVHAAVQAGAHAGDDCLAVAAAAAGGSGFPGGQAGSGPHITAAPAGPEDAAGPLPGGDGGCGSVGAADGLQAGSGLQEEEDEDVDEDSDDSLRSSSEGEEEGDISDGNDGGHVGSPAAAAAGRGMHDDDSAATAAGVPVRRPGRPVPPRLPRAVALQIMTTPEARVPQHSSSPAAGRCEVPVAGASEAAAANGKAAAKRALHLLHGASSVGLGSRAGAGRVLRVSWPAQTCCRSGAARPTGSCCRCARAVQLQASFPVLMLVLWITDWYTQGAS